MLSLEHVSFRYPGTPGNSLHDASVELAEGSITGLVGPAGGGKSTICLIAAGLAPRSTGGRAGGTMRIDGVAVPWSGLVGPEMVTLGLQDPAGQLSMVADTVYEEVAFGPSNLGLARPEMMDRTVAALELFGIEELAKRDPRRLSGGEQQLVVLAGLLAMQPRHLVLDEPGAHLDASGTRRLVAALQAAAGEGTAILIAEQRTDLLLGLCDSIAVVAAGNIVERGSPRAVLTDETVVALGVPEPPELRLERRLRDSVVRDVETES